MERQAVITSLHAEVETLIRLYRQGLYNTTGFRARKRRMEDLIREHKIDIRKELDPVTQILYRRYLT